MNCMQQFLCPGTDYIPEGQHPGAYFGRLFFCVNTQWKEDCLTAETKLFFTARKQE